MQRNDDLKYTILLSLIIHFLLLMLLSSLYVIRGTNKTVYLTEVTLITEMPYGRGLGQKGTVTESEGKKTGTLAIKKEDISADKTDESAVKTAKISPRTQEDIMKIRKSTPIGIDESSLKTQGGIIEGPVFGGGYGEDTEKPGSPDGNPEIFGPIASRGIKHSVMPAYPEWAKKKGIEGEIKVQITVTPKGDVREILVLKTCGFKELDQLVINSMRNWIFDPLPLSANQINQEGMIKFKFNLKK